MKINICDIGFGHAETAFNGDLKNVDSIIKWNRNFNRLEPCDLCFFTDRNLHDAEHINAKVKIAFVLEPRSIYSNSYDYLIGNHSKFDYVLTHHRELLNVIPNAVYYPHGGTWIEPDDQLIYDKIKDVSIIASNKRDTDGHRLRHAVVEHYSDKIDLVCGRGYNPIDYKLDALKEYRHSVVIENSKIDGYFTEKIIDCFLTGTVPIYYGCEDIDEWFNIDGIIKCDDVNDIGDILGSDLLYEYTQRMDAIKENFELAKKYSITENVIYDLLCSLGIIND